MATYRFLLMDIQSRTVLSEAITMSVGSYSRRLNGSGDLQARLDLSDRTVRELTDPISATEPRRTSLWIIRDETPVWGGIIWTRLYRSDDEAFDLGASSFESYLGRRRLRNTLTFSQVDQHTILWELLKHSATKPYGDVGIDWGLAPPASGIRRDRSYYWHERASYLERAQQLSSVINGPDFSLQPEFDSNLLPTVQLRVGTPLSEGGWSRMVIDYPGSIRNYSWPEDGGHSANFWTAIGDPTDPMDPASPPLMADAQMSAEWTDGDYPLLEDVSQHQGVSDVGTLSEHAQAAVAAAAGNLTIPTATLRIPDEGLPGIGDYISVRITDPVRFPEPPMGGPGLFVIARVVGWTVYLGAEGETVSLELGQAA